MDIGYLITTLICHVAGVPPFCVETVPFQVYLGGYADHPVQENRVDTSVQRSAGRNTILTVRYIFEFMYK